MTDPRTLLEEAASTVVYAFGPDDGRTYAERDPAPYAALRAVLDEHVVVDFGGSYGKSCKTCRSGPAVAPYPNPWPCPTVRAITTALEAP